MATPVVTIGDDAASSRASREAGPPPSARTVGRIPRRRHRSDDDRARFLSRADGRLVRTGLASAISERVVAGKRELEVARVRITAAGRKALAEMTR
jgi:hypothetical protein